MHSWLFVRILPTATVKMVDKGRNHRIKETYSFLILNEIFHLSLSFGLLHDKGDDDSNATCIKVRDETCKLLSMTIPDALGNIAARLESQKIVS